MLSYEEAIALFERRKVAWLAEDLEGYLAFWADEMTFQSPAHPEPLRGKDAYADLLRSSADLVRPISFDVASLAVTGDHVLAEWRITLEWRADGRRITYPGMSSATLKDGLITEWREYWKPADMMPAT